MTRYDVLLKKKKQLQSILSTLDKTASFDTEEGRVYAQYLVMSVVVNLELEQIEKEKVAQ